MKTYKQNYEVWLRPESCIPIRIAHYKRDKKNKELAKSLALAVSSWDKVRVEVWDSIFDVIVTGYQEGVEVSCNDQKDTINEDIRRSDERTQSRPEGF